MNSSLSLSTMVGPADRDSARKDNLDPKVMAALAKGTKQQRAIVQRIAQLENDVTTVKVENQDLLEKLRAVESVRGLVVQRLCAHRPRCCCDGQRMCSCD